MQDSGYEESSQDKNLRQIIAKLDDLTQFHLRILAEEVVDRMDTWHKAVTLQYIVEESFDTIIDNL